MQTAHFHFRRRDAPLGLLKIKFSPFSLAKLARSDKDQWRKLQSCFCQRQSVIILDGSKQRADKAGSTMVARWMTFGAGNAPANRLTDRGDGDGFLLPNQHDQSLDATLTSVTLKCPFRGIGLHPATNDEDGAGGSLVVPQARLNKFLSN